MVMIPRLSRLLPLLLALPTALLAQSKPAVTPADYPKWESLAGAALSPNGRWLAYAVNREENGVTQKMKGYKLSPAELDGLVALMRSFG